MTTVPRGGEDKDRLDNRHLPPPCGVGRGAAGYLKHMTVATVRYTL